MVGWMDGWMKGWMNEGVAGKAFHGINIRLVCTHSSLLIGLSSPSLFVLSIRARAINRLLPRREYGKMDGRTVGMVEGWMEMDEARYASNRTCVSSEFRVASDNVEHGFFWF